MTQNPQSAGGKSAPTRLLADFDWTQARWVESVCRVPALILGLVLAIPLHQPAAGVVAAGAALSVGLVGNRRIAGSPFWAMIATTFIMALSAWIGTVVGASSWLGPVVVALWGLSFAFLTIHDDDSGWVAMQGVICLVIAMAFPSHGYEGLWRSLSVMAGGALQIGVLALIDGFRRFFPPQATRGDIAGLSPPATNYPWNDLLLSFRSFSSAWKYALRVSLTMIVAVEVAGVVHIQNSYWLPMTTVIILKPDFYRTYSGAVLRVVGTFLGVIVASLIAHLLHPNMPWLLVLVAVFSFGCFAFLKVNPIPFSASLTAYVVFLIATTGLPETAITGHRLVLTALGSALALGSRILGSTTILSLFGGKLKT